MPHFTTNHYFCNSDAFNKKETHRKKGYKKSQYKLLNSLIQLC